MNTLASISLAGSGIPLALFCAGVGLVFALVLIRSILVAPAGNEKMARIAGAVQEGAKAYLNRQILTIGAIALVLIGALFFLRGPATALGFFIGARVRCRLATWACAWRCSQMCARRRRRRWAASGAEGSVQWRLSVTGVLVVTLALFAVGGYFLIARHWLRRWAAITSLVGLALGASLISVFARLGGGIYTKAADVGADLVGKIEQHLDEDDPRNPATIADNVGDNVGDCAGMAADVFETYAVSSSARCSLPFSRCMTCHRRSFIRFSSAASRCSPRWSAFFS